MITGRPIRLAVVVLVACAVRAEEPDDLSLGHFEGDVLDGVPVAIQFREPLRLNHWQRP